MRTLISFLFLSLTFCAEIGGYDETPEGWTSNYTGVTESHWTTDREPEEILSEGDANCEAYAITGPKKEKDCNQFVLEDPDYRCCYITFEIGTYKNAICQRIAYTESSIGDMKYAFRQASHVSILCEGIVLKVKYIYLLLLIFLL